MNPLMNSNVPKQIAPPQMVSQFMQDPVGALRSVGYNIPDGMKNPQEIVNHLINNGQLNNSKFAQLQNMARFFTNTPVRPQKPH